MIAPMLEQVQCEPVLCISVRDTGRLPRQRLRQEDNAAALARASLIAPVLEQVKRELVLGIDDPDEQEAVTLKLRHW